MTSVVGSLIVADATKTNVTIVVSWKVAAPKIK